MQIHELRTKHKRKGIKRIGRGGKRGTYSGRGQKGQRARAGHRIRPALRDTLSRLPKIRGVKHKSIKAETVILNIRDLIRRFPDTAVINKQVLLERNIIKKMRQPVKVLGQGEIKRSVTIQGLLVSKQAKEKILKAGGKIE